MEEVSKENIEGVLGYLNAIKSYDMLSFQHSSAMVLLMWSFIFFFAGILDYIFIKIEYPEGTTISWIVPTLFGVLFSFLSTYKLTTGKDKIVEREKQSVRDIVKIMLVFIPLSWVVAMLLAFYGDPRYIFVLIPTIVGIVFILHQFNRIDSDMDESLAARSTREKISFLVLSNPPILGLFLSTFINFLGIIIVGESYTPFLGLVMGVTLGLGFAYNAFILLKDYYSKQKLSTSH